MPHRFFAISSAPRQFDDLELMDRIVASYRKAIATPIGATSSMWLSGELFELRRDVHDQLMDVNQAGARALLRDPGATDLFVGFEDNAKSQRVKPFNTAKESMSATQYDKLVTLAEATAAIRLRYPRPAPGADLSIEMSEILKSLDATFGTHVEFPNPFPGEAGIDTGRGILTYRAAHALYQAWRIRQLTQGVSSPRVLEIGAGLGRTAYYAWKLGIRDYTIVDLPLTCVAQADFLGRTLEPRHLQLFGESNAGHIRIMPPAAFLKMHDLYDVAINVDSLTEMAVETAKTYFEHIDRRANMFLSINHEGNAFQARDFYANRQLLRAPYWFRAGYVEELIRTARDSGQKSGTARAALASIATKLTRVLGRRWVNRSRTPA